MILFNCDYSEGAHPSVLQKLSQTNLEQVPGYGADTYCKQAAQQIQKACHAPQADVHFLCGGTQTNLTVIAACLRPYQCVFSADSGHINVHETGAIEATGHRIYALPAEQGKITAEQISRACKTIGPMITLNLPPNPSWSICLSPPNTEHFIAKKSFLPFAACVTKTTFSYLLMAPVWDMA